MTAINQEWFSPDPYAIYADPSRPSPEQLGYTPDVWNEIDAEIRALFRGYGTAIVYGKRSPSPCSAWRSERMLLSNEALSRFANRVHIFEGQRQDRPGRYLGFLSIRPTVLLPGKFRHTAIAYITAPRFMLRPRYHIITAAIGAAEGIQPFRGVPFCIPNRDTGNRSSCLHSCICEALLLKMNTYGCTTINSQEMLILLTQNASAREMWSIYWRGASLEQARDVLRSKEVKAGALLETFIQPENDAIARLHTLRCITDYLANGIPLIISRDLPNDEICSRPKRKSKLHHATLVFGMHISVNPDEQNPYDPLSGSACVPKDVEDAVLPGRLVCHDVNDGPFVEIDSVALLNQAWFKAKGNGDPGISFLAVAPKGARMPISEVRTNAEANLEFDRLDPAGHHVIVRLLRLEQLNKRYLVDTQDLLDTGQLVSQLSEKQDETDYWWCAEAWPREADAAREPGIPSVVYMWPISADSDSENSITTARLLRVNNNRAVVFTDCDGKDHYYEFGGQSA